MSPIDRFGAPARAVHVRRLVAVVVASILVWGGLTVPAAAATSGIELTVSYGTTTGPDGTTVITPGTEYQARLQYKRNELVPGSTVVLVAPEGTRIPDSALVVPPGNTVFESLTRQADGSIAIKVLDDLSESSVDQGVFTMSFVMDEPTGGSEVRDLTWSIDGVGQTVTVIVKKSGDEILQPFADRTAKSVINGGALNRYVTVDAAGTVSVDAAIATVLINYTIAIDSRAARTGIDITDTINASMEYVPGSFAANLTTWDANGLNKTTAPLPSLVPSITGNTFTYAGVDLPADSKLAITYSARLSAAAIASLQADLQAKADAVNKATGGNFVSQPFANTLVVTGVPTNRTAQFTVRGSIAQPAIPNLPAVMTKSSNLPANTVVEVDDDGTLVEPVAVTYTLGADLRDFTPAYPLTQNVVIRDTLPAQMEWVTGAGFITATDETGAPVPLTRVADVTPTDFAGDAYIGRYMVFGQDLWINVGANEDHKYSYAVKARIVSVDGVPTTVRPASLPTVETLYRGPDNTATFTFGGTGSPVTKTVSERLVVLKDSSTSITDSTKFSKTAPATIVAQPGSSIVVPFTFRVNSGYDFARSAIIDYVDPNVFDLSDLDAIKDGITGMYDYNGPLNGDSFDLEVDADGNLVITASDQFTNAWPSWKNKSGPYTRLMTVTVPLPTKVLVGSQTLRITNTAVLRGTATDPWTYTSTAEATGTTYGDEMEVHKALYDDGDWTDNLRAPVDGDGTLISDEFIYRVELIPHGNFEGVRIIPVEDALPAGLEFLGFVSDANLATGIVDPGPAFPMGGNIEATWIDATRTLDMRNLTGTVLESDEPIFVNFKVRAVAYTENVGITNAIGNQTATFTPSNGFPLSIAKQDATDANVVISDRDARFTITGPSGVVTDAAYVVGGMLKVSDGKGADASVIVTQPGTYTITETVAPRGYQLASDPITVTVAANGSSPTVTFFNTPSDEVATGTVSISKTVTGGVDATTTPFDFTWTAAAPGGQTLTAAQSSGSVSVRADGVAVPLGIDFPVGTVVTFAEAAAPAFAGFTFDSVTFTGNPATVVGDADVSVSAVNRYTEDPVIPPVDVDAVGTVSISKTVVGAFGGRSNDYVFTWTAVAPAGQTLVAQQSSGSVSLKGDGVAVPLGINFPEGTVVTFTEGTVPEIFGFTFDKVTYTGNGATVIGDATVNVSAVNTFVAKPIIGFADVGDESGAGLAQTGAANVGLLAWSAALLAALGAAFVYVGRRRRGDARP